MKVYKVPQSPRLIRKKSRTGLGLFAGEHIKKGAFIITYTGEKITADEADKRGGQYLFELNAKWTLDGKGRENTARYINHSCKPNAEAEVKGHQVFITAKRTILPGEEITYDYGKEFWKEYIKPKGCKCDKCITTATK
jgi:SET domain-containing protein